MSSDSYRRDLARLRDKEATLRKELHRHESADREATKRRQTERRKTRSGDAD